MQINPSVVVGWMAGWCGLLIANLPLAAQQASDYAVRVSATVQANPPQIALTWPAVEQASAYRVSRKSKNEAVWGPPVSLPGTAAGYVDQTVAANVTYEYRVSRSIGPATAHGYVFAGIQAPLVDSRGKLILIVDSSQAARLVPELNRFQQDLVGDGWTVVRHDVPRMSVSADSADPALWSARSNEVAAVKQLIKADYAADPASLRAVFLFGRVPVPYSGALAPDGHPDHLGAWPADVFYGDMTGVWTDSTVINRGSNDPRNHNVPGDGKFDQDYIPGNVALEVGRVDMANLPAFAPETDLLRQYLEKNHRFRHKLITAQPWGVVNDNLGLLGGEVPAAVNGWGNLSALLGAENVQAGRWLTEFIRGEYLWGYGCGPGTFTQAAGVADSIHFLVYDTRVVFTMLFGSYFGDWDSENNFLRAQLVTPSYTLTSAWAGRPNWFFHHMGMGETIGFSARVTQNNTGLYEGLTRTNGVGIVGPGDPRGFMNQVHIALMGDPTLRLHPVAPPPDLAALTNSSGGVDLSWASSAEAVLGYHVYRAPTAGGPYARLTGSLVLGTSYTDASFTAERFYMVRAISLQTSASGTYYNASQGAFAEVDRSPDIAEQGLWTGRGERSWRISDVMGTAGSHPGWDMVNVDGSLIVNATFANQFTVRIISFDPSGNPGPAANFNRDNRYRWPILTAPGGVLGFDPAKIRLLTDEFEGDLGGGLFSVELSGDGTTILLVFEPNRSPEARPAEFFRAWDVPLRINLNDFIREFTSDPDGDIRTLVLIGSSTNGTEISSENREIVFRFNNNQRETISYWVQDARPYRIGDTVRVAQSTITIQPLPIAPPSTAYHAIEVEWQTEIGKSYQVQFRLENGAEWIDRGLPIPGNGEKMSIFERASNPAKFYRVILVQ